MGILTIHIGRSWHSKKSPKSTIPASNKEHILRGGALCVWALTAAVHKMDSCDIILSAEDAAEINSLIYQHLLHWQGLAQYYQHQNVLRWKLRPKHHDLEEISKKVMETRVNPRFTACWQDESYLGQLKMVATRCHSATVLLRIFQRIILRLGQKWQEVRNHSHDQARGSWEKDAAPWPSGAPELREDGNLVLNDFHFKGHVVNFEPCGLEYIWYGDFLKWRVIGSHL
jgi:hypothetical protein